MNKLMVILAALVGLFALTGCETLFGKSATQALGERVAESAEGFNDVEAYLKRKLVCSVDVGAMYRTYTKAEMEAISIFCDPARRGEVEPETIFVERVSPAEVESGVAVVAE